MTTPPNRANTVRVTYYRFDRYHLDPSSLHGRELSDQTTRMGDRLDRRLQQGRRIIRPRTKRPCAGFHARRSAL